MSRPLNSIAKGSRATFNIAVILAAHQHQPSSLKFMALLPLNWLYQVGGAWVEDNKLYPTPGNAQSELNKTVADLGFFSGDSDKKHRLVAAAQRVQNEFGPRAPDLSFAAP